jgi:hypothetical protein
MILDRLGPPLESLIHRLAETPREFLDEPRIQGRGQVAVAALAHDLMVRLGQTPSPEFLARLEGRGGAAERNRLSLTAVMIWLLSDDWFMEHPDLAIGLSSLLTDTAASLAEATAAERYTSDPDRREELARTSLAAFGCHPAGETPQQAVDRLTAVSGAERRRLLQASREAEERARAVREALVRKAAQESADKWSRE